jgi:hypothetical protein
MVQRRATQEERPDLIEPERGPTHGAGLGSPGGVDADVYSDPGCVFVLEGMI